MSTNRIEGATLISIPNVLSDHNESLCFFEATRTVPFEIRRVYYITNVKKNRWRGAHAHKTLKQFMFCPYGSVRIKIDNGHEKSVFVLDNPSLGLLLSNQCLWRDIQWIKSNSVLCVAVSDYYDETDYIREYKHFISYVKNKQQ